MRLRHLSLRDFRSYTEAEVELADGVTTFVGLNGQGKTNLVEAIGYLSTLSSHRVGADTALVRRAAPGVYSWLPLGLRALRKIEAGSSARSQRGPWPPG